MLEEIWRKPSIILEHQAHLPVLFFKIQKGHVAIPVGPSGLSAVRLTCSSPSCILIPRVLGVGPLLLCAQSERPQNQPVLMVGLLKLEPSLVHVSLLDWLQAITLCLVYNRRACSGQGDAWVLPCLAMRLAQ